jgi:MptA/FolE2 family GTP cyclohydrolase
MGSQMEYNGIYELHFDQGTVDFRSGVVCYVTSLCPCSKEISDYGAHSQRSEVKIMVHPRANQQVQLGELVDIAEASASAPLYPLLKREDERHVTMRAYDNPVFVEDLSRNVAQALHKLEDRLDKARIEVTNFESIHRHDAFAEIELIF